MSTNITTTGVHHIRLIVTDVARSLHFYTSLLNFQLAAELPPGVVLTNGNILLGLTPAWDGSQAIPNDHFSPNRVGLDHLSFSVADRAELEKAAALFAERGVVHGEVRDLPPFGITILSFDDPDGIQVELTAPLA
ncbi:MAG TPA: VOC family protein [Ktedonosporobacter sp.]|nr:VOC family protein [Ktedonosporobacter sp.]